MLLLPSRVRPKLLDLYCCAGGAAKGYQRAGFHVTGIDRDSQPRYCGDRFIQSDALEYLAAHWREYDAFHASPPCQTHTALKSLYQSSEAYLARHVDLIDQTRAILLSTGKPFIIENVPGAPLENPIMLCGAQFGLKVYRHRLFEVSPWMLAPSHIPHNDNTPAVGRGLSSKGFISITGTGGFGIPDGFKYACEAIGIDWMIRRELSQAIPPAFAEFTGRHLFKVA